ncbi:phytanoyl-CoA dioxygenase family protein [Sphingomonas sp. 22176]|uniref:phytanoyl-CoA dioxygenase family protein n=1 Tax=Sphingomonas sp. 22176 TaxID=3453884 RepID=UPI003F8283A3
MLDRMDASDLIAQSAGDLRAHAWCFLHDVLPQAQIRAFDVALANSFATIPFGESGFYGTITKRLGRLLLRAAGAAALVQHPRILGIVESMLAAWCGCIQLNATQAIAVHPSAPAHLPHRDQDKWRGPVGTIEYLFNAMWPLTAFTQQNGATLVWPDSHGALALTDTCGPPFAAAVRPGDALLFLGSTLHGAAANRSQAVRPGIIIGYALGWLKPYENQWLVYPPEIARSFSPDLAALIGYRQHRANLGNFEGHCPVVLLHGPADRPRGAVDALRPDQEALVEAHLKAQRGTS